MMMFNATFMLWLATVALLAVTVLPHAASTFVAYAVVMLFVTYFALSRTSG